MRTLIASIAIITCGVSFADECRDLSHAKRAHVFVITDSAGPVYGYVELADVMTAWKTTQTNWTKTIQGSSIGEVRRKLAGLMKDEVIRNPRPPKIEKDQLFGDYVEWGTIDDNRKSIYNTEKWVPQTPTKYWKTHWKRTFTLSSKRD